MSKLTIKKILAEVGCARLSLHYVGQGYFYFEYDEPEANVYDTLSIFVPRLSAMSLDSWVSDAQGFVQKMDAVVERISNPT